MKNQIVTYILLFQLAVGAFEMEAQSSHQALRKGDRKYDRERYQEAEQNYRIAADAKFGDPKAVYNLGNALYQQGKWEDAAQRFGQAARDFQTTTEQSNAWHNLGNAQMKLNKFKPAVEAYENSLRLRPGNPETKMNLQMAKKKLKEEEEKEKQKQQQQQQEQQKNQETPPEQNPNEQNQPNQPPPRPKEEQKNQSSPSQPDQNGNPQEQPKTKMSKEEAKRLLESAVDPEDQRNARKYRSAQPSRNKRSKKDW